MTEPEQPDSPAHVTSVESPVPHNEWTEPHSIPEDTDPQLQLETPPRRVGLWVAVGAVVCLAGVGAAVLGMRGDADSTATAEPPVAAAPEAPPPPAAPKAALCPDLDALAGAWSLTTEVTGSRVVQSFGLNGFYTLDVSVEGCSATATMTKLGYTARMYSEARVQRATAELVPDARTGLLTGTFLFESTLGAQGTVEFSFAADDETLSGVYRQRGDKWADGGLSGFLQGNRGSERPRELIAAAQPCSVRCNLSCDSAGRDTLGGAALSSCVDTCESEPAAAAQCGDVAPLPDEHALTLQGPMSRKAMCKSMGGCAKKIGRAPGPRLDSERLPDGWTEVSMLRGKREGGVRLALHGEAGWWLSDPLFETSPHAKLGKLRLYARQLSEGVARQYVLGLARTPGGGREAYLACRLNTQPACVRVLKPRGAHVNALPEGNLAVADAGVFRW